MSDRRFAWCRRCGLKRLMDVPPGICDECRAAKRLRGWMWCEVCKAWRHVNGDPHCWRCEWDMRARVVPKWSTLHWWRTRDDG